MKDDELRQYYDMFTNLWKLMVKYQNPIDDDAFWEGLKIECKELSERYGDTEFIINEVVNIQFEIKRIWKEKSNVSNL